LDSLLYFRKERERERNWIWYEGGNELKKKKLDARRVLVVGVLVSKDRIEGGIRYVSRFGIVDIQQKVGGGKGNTGHTTNNLRKI